MTKVSFKGIIYGQKGDLGEFGFDFNAARAQIIELKVNVPDANELHVAIDAAIESEISGLRIDPLVGAVIDANGQ